MALMYQTGEDIHRGDRVTYGGNAGVIELVVEALTGPSFKSEHLGAAAAALGYGITTGSKYFGTTTLVSGDAAFTSARNVCSR